MGSVQLSVQQNKTRIAERRKQQLHQHLKQIYTQLTVNGNRIDDKQHSLIRPRQTATQNTAKEKRREGEKSIRN